MKIHGFVYLIIGVFMVAYSKFTGGDEAKLIIFVWIGYFFLFVGIVKILLKTILGRGKISKKNFSHQTAHHPLENLSQSHSSLGEQAVKFCAKCGSTVRHFDKFCSQCGNRHFHK